MAVYEISYWNGDIEEVEAESIGDAKRIAEEANPGIGVKCAVLIDEDEDDDDDDDDDKDSPAAVK